MVYIFYNKKNLDNSTILILTKGGIKDDEAEGQGPGGARHRGYFYSFLYR